MQDILKIPEVIEGNKAKAVRRTHEYDEQLFSAIDNNRNFLRKYLYWVDATKSIEDVKKSTGAFIEKWNNHTNYAWLIVDANNKIVGSIDIQTIDYKNHNNEFGYFLIENATGNGYVSDILKRLENILFNKGMVRLVIKCDAENTASNNVAVRNGYTLEGTAVKSVFAYGEYRNINIYAKIKQDSMHENQKQNS